jgi:integrase
MSANHPTTPTPTAKPTKPSPDFPLFPHASGVWAKKIRGKLYYFAPWSDPDGALKKYEEQKEELHSGRKARPFPDATTIKDVCNHFLNSKKDMVDAGQLASVTFAGYRTAAEIVVSTLGKGRLVDDLRPDDFANLWRAMSRRWGVRRLGLMVTGAKSIFKHAVDSDLIDRPVKFGPQFKVPSKKTIRLHRAQQGPKLFTADEVRRMVAGANVHLRAMLLLGINCGFGNADVGTLPLTALDLDRGWVNFPRPKTGINRRCPLWPETVATIQESLTKRRDPKDPSHAGLVFITRLGRAWSKACANNPLVLAVATLLHRLGINGRTGLGFYTLRHTFRTVADGSKDQPAVDHVMGHESPHMSTVYRETISDARLRAVADHVHAWLFGEAAVQ